MSQQIDIKPVEKNWFKKMYEQLTTKTVVIIIAGGILVFLLLFIFAKRQIMRFALRSHRGPHAPLGTDTTKSLRREIFRRIDAVKKIIYEPKVIRDEVAMEMEKEDSIKPCHYYRMRAVDDARNLEQSMIIKKLGKRQSFESLRSYFIIILTPQADPRIVHQFCDLYEAARFNPKLFNKEEYAQFRILLRHMRQAVSTSQPKSVRSPAKQSKLIVGKGTPESGKKMVVPYMRKLTKKEKAKWGQGEEELSLCDASAHEISIVSPNKDESTIV